MEAIINTKKKKAIAFNHNISLNFFPKNIDSTVLKFVYILRLRMTQ